MNVGSLEGTSGEGGKGSLMIGMDVYGFTPSMVMVEVKKEKAQDGEKREVIQGAKVQKNISSFEATF